MAIQKVFECSAIGTAAKPIDNSDEFRNNEGEFLKFICLVQGGFEMRNFKIKQDKKEDFSSGVVGFRRELLHKKERFFNRELSWLEFNQRVLEQAITKKTPLLERLRFFDIFISNLDEFYMRRVGRLRNQVLSPLSFQSLDGLSPKQQITKIKERVQEQMDLMEEGLTGQVYPSLEREGIRLFKWSELKKDSKEKLAEVFISNIFPILTPLAVDYGHPFPFISNLSKSLGVCLLHPVSGEKVFSRVKIPHEIPQWYCIEDEKGDAYINIEEIVINNLMALFPGTEILDKLIFRVTRNSGFEGDEDGSLDLKEHVEEGLREQKFSPVIRLEYCGETKDSWILDYIKNELEIDSADVYRMGCLPNYTRFAELIKMDKPHLKFRPWKAKVPREFLDRKSNIFHKIKGKDIIVHHPYESFSSSVERFIETAANDPKVLAIKITLYRTTLNSKIIESLIFAAQNGKQVACLVELKARFEEEQNMRLTEKLERDGIHVITGMVGLKTHSKMCLVVRQDHDKVTTYAHLGTGNYNPITSNIYTDLGLFTCREEVTREIVEVFNFLTGFSQKKDYKTLLVAPLNIKKRFLKLIDKEIKAKRELGYGRIVAKMNSLEDPDIIKALYEASMGGVKIELLVRGFCCLRPGVPGLSENIEVFSVIGRFLEHSRVYYFSGGQKEPLEGQFYIGSADWMWRNLMGRVEVITPLLSAESKSITWNILNVNLKDSVSSWALGPDGKYDKRECEGKNVLGTHEYLMREYEKNAD